MASQGPLSPATCESVFASQSAPWVNPGNASAEDGAVTSSGIGAETPSYYLHSTNYSFSIPAGSTINGITAEAKVFYSDALNGPVVKDFLIQIIKGGTKGATNRADANAWTTTPTYKTWGGAADLWGETWTVSDINASNFGFSILCVDVSGTEPPDVSSATAKIDHVRLTVHYTPAAGPGSGTNHLLGVGK